MIVDETTNTVMGEIAQRWGRMLFSGASTFWETDKGLHDFDGAGSLCHGWSAVPIYIYGITRSEKDERARVSSATLACSR